MAQDFCGSGPNYREVQRFDLLFLLNAADDAFCWVLHWTKIVWRAATDECFFDRIQLPNRTISVWLVDDWVLSFLDWKLIIWFLEWLLWLNAWLWSWNNNFWVRLSTKPLKNFGPYSVQIWPLHTGPDWNGLVQKSFLGVF